MLKFEKLEIRNFMSYSNSPVVIDLNTGLHLILGENGSGKSAMAVDALFYVLYGKSFKRLSNSELINRMNGKGMSIALSFSRDGINYKLKRGLKPNILEIYKNNERVENYNKKDMQNFIEEDIIKFDEKVFKQIVILGSELHTPFLKLSLPERRFLIEKLFDFDVLVKLKETFKSDYKDREKNLDILKSEKNINLTKVESLKEELERIENENKKIVERREKNEKDIKSDIEREKKEFDVLKNQIENEKVEDRKELFEKVIEKISNDIDGLNKEYAANLEKLNKKLHKENFELIKKENDIKNNLREIEVEIEKKTESISGLFMAIHDEEYIKEEHNLNEYKNKLDKIELFKKAEFDVLRGKIGILKDNMSKEVKRKEFYQKNDDCEVCGTVFTAEKKIEIVKEIEENMIRFTKEEMTIQKKIDELREEKRLYKKDIEKKIEVIREKVEEISKRLRDECKEKEKIVKNEIKNLEDKRKKLRETKKENEKIISLFNEKKEKLVDALGKKYDGQIEKLRLEKIECLKEKKANEVQIDRLKELKNKLSLKNQMIQVLNDKLKENEKIDLIDTKEIKKKLNENRKMFKEKRIEIVKREKYLQYLERIVYFFSDNGIRRVLIKKYLPLLNGKIAEFLSEFDCNFDIEFDEGFDTIVKSRGKEINYNACSSGQKQRIDLSVLFTFMEFLKMKQGINCNLLIFDEILDSSLDEKGVGVFFRLLERFSMKENYSIFVISHRESNVNYFSNIYKVEMENGFSKIEKMMV